MSRRREARPAVRGGGPPRAHRCWSGGARRAPPTAPASCATPATGDLLKRSPFLSGIVAIIFVYGVVAGVAYGVGAGTIKSDSDVIKGMGQSMSTLGVYLVLVFFAAQFVAFFNWTQLGLIFAVEGAGLLQGARPAERSRCCWPSSC
jgi:p-aminobenzoyl-glutamate transporter AbgT